VWKVLATASLVAYPKYQGLSRSWACYDSRKYSGLYSYQRFRQRLTLLPEVTTAAWEIEPLGLYIFRMCKWDGKENVIVGRYRT
jgi:hypothetical protein